MYTGPWRKVEGICRKFLDNQYDFGIGVSEIADLTGIEAEDAEKLISIFSRNNSKQYVFTMLALFTLTMNFIF